MSAYVLLRVEQHRLALGASAVREFDRGDDGVVLLPLGGPEEVSSAGEVTLSAASAGWVVALVDGQRWRVASRPGLVELERVNPLPPMLSRWASEVGVRGWASTPEGLVLVVTTRFAERAAS